MGKTLPKSLLLKLFQKEKTPMEMCIHRSLIHQHVTGSCAFFKYNDLRWSSVAGVLGEERTE